MDIQLNLDSFNKTYSIGDLITGNITIKNKKNESKYNLSLILIGRYHLSNKKVQPPIRINEKFITKEHKIVTNSDLQKGISPNHHFSFPLIPEKDESFYESYRGVILSVYYEINANVQINNNENYESEKIRIEIFVPGMGIRKDFGCKLVPYYFNLTPKNIEKNELKNEKLPDFNIECFINNINCNFNKPFDGYINIHNCNVEIKSVELQFLRHEEADINGVKNNETSEIQNLQIGDGDVNKNVEIPLFMIFPKTFSCANCNAPHFQISFEINIMIVLVNGIIITDNFPINIWRG